MARNDPRILGCTPQLATYRMARACGIHYGITASMVHHCDSGTVVARGRLLKHDGEVLPFLDGTRPRDVMAQVQALSEWYADYRRTAPEVRSTGANL